MLNWNINKKEKIHILDCCITKKETILFPIFIIKVIIEALFFFYIKKPLKRLQDKIFKKINETI